MKLSEILGVVGCGYELISDGTFNALEQCTNIRAANALTYVENIKYAYTLSETNISCLICASEIRESIPGHIQGLVISDEPKVLFYQIHNYLVDISEKKENHIDPSAKISPLAYIAPYNVCIGKNVEILPFASVHEGSIIEDDVLICESTVIGCQSFNVVKRRDGSGFLVRDAGTTRICKGAEISCNDNIERGTHQLDETVIGPYSKMDNGVTIGHGSQLGRRVLIAANSVVAGNCMLGDEVWMGVNATLSNRVSVGARARVSLGAVVTKDVAPDTTVTGNFAIAHSRFLENLKKSIS